MLRPRIPGHLFLSHRQYIRFLSGNLGTVAVIAFLPGDIQLIIYRGYCTKSRENGLDFMYVDDRVIPKRYLPGLEHRNRRCIDVMSVQR